MRQTFIPIIGLLLGSGLHVVRSAHLDFMTKRNAYNIISHAQRKRSISILDIDKLDIDVSESCQEIGPCLYCTADDLSRVDMLNVCELTGRRSKFICKEVDDDGEISEYSEYRSCTRTSTEDEFSMLRLQVVCLITAILSLFSVRQQKQLNASLFDQRIAKRRNTSDAQIGNTHLADVENDIAMSLSLSRPGDGTLPKAECERLINK